MTAEFRIYKNNGEADILKWKERLRVADDLSAEQVFDLFKEKFLMEAKEITFPNISHYRTEKRGDLVLTFYW